MAVSRIRSVWSSHAVANHRPGSARTSPFRTPVPPWERSARRWSVAPTSTTVPVPVDDDQPVGAGVVVGVVGPPALETVRTCRRPWRSNSATAPPPTTTTRSSGRKHTPWTGAPSANAACPTRLRRRPRSGPARRHLRHRDRRLRADNPEPSGDLALVLERLADHRTRRARNRWSAASTSTPGTGNSAWIALFSPSYPSRW